MSSLLDQVSMKLTVDQIKEVLDENLNNQEFPMDVYHSLLVSLSKKIDETSFIRYCDSLRELLK